MQNCSVMQPLLYPSSLLALFCISWGNLSMYILTNLNKTPRLISLKIILSLPKSTFLELQTNKRMGTPVADIALTSLLFLSTRIWLSRCSHLWFNYVNLKKIIFPIQKRKKKKIHQILKHIPILSTIDVHDAQFPSVLNK